MALRLSDGRLLTLSNAMSEDRNLLSRLHHSNKTTDISEFIWSQRATVEALCAHHLGLHKEQCVVQDKTTWMGGQFNICVLLLVTEANGATRRKIFRCPMAHKVAETSNPGSMEEKVRVEVANYVFAETHCPEIPVPQLAGFGLSSNHRFTHERHLSWLPRWYSKARRILSSILWWQTQAPYARTTSNITFDIPYILLDFIDEDEGRMLSDTWKKQRHDAHRRQNLLRSLSRIMLSLARFPQHRIGCLRFMDDRSIALASPPLLCANTILESEGAPRKLHDLPSCSGQFLSSLLAFRCEVFRTQPNAVKDDADCRLQMSHLMLLKLLIPQLVDVGYKGPFVLQYTDLHASNLFVDDEWNITGIIDLEFVCSLPPGMLNVPHWLTADHIDELSDHLDEHNRHRAEFLQVLESEEKFLKPALNFTLSHAISSSWNSGENWLWRCFTSIDALPSIMEDHLWRQYGFDPQYSEYCVFAAYLSNFWSKSSEEFVNQKRNDKARYDEDLRSYYDTISHTRTEGNAVSED